MLRENLEAKMKFSQDQFGRHFIINWPQTHCYTIFTKDNLCKRGEYAEEIDVLAGTPGQARKIAQVILDCDYDPELRISRIEMVW